MPFLLPAAAVAGTAAAGAGAAAGAASLGGAAAAAAAEGVGASFLSASTLATAATIGSSAISALGSIAQSRASAASAGYNAKVQQQNAQIETQNSQFAGAEGERNTAAAGAKTRAALAETLANQGASGVDVNTGSSVNVRESQAKIGALDALNVRAEAARRAYGYQTSAASDIGQSQLYRSQQKSSTTGGYLDAGATVLGGVWKASKYTNWLNEGGM